MAEREKILRYYRASGDEAVAAQLLDLAETTLRSRKYKISDFLDPYGFTIAETIIAHYDGRLVLQALGGYEDAERNKAVFISNDYLGKVDSPLAALQISWDGRYDHLSHRDVLGALIGLGIKREVFGDILMQGEQCQIIVDRTLAAFILENLTDVGSARVSVAEIALTDIVAPEKKVKEIKTTVASLRLDVIAAAGFGVSRSRMADEIAADKVKVNWQSAKNSAQTVKQGDVLSMRGRGRVEVCEIIGQTKKGRTSIFLKRFI
ncbi:RNA-binding protein [Propionispora vibrioides]|uniref:RNA-binding protein YlmH, contains S4-like domain n=1 Tax=Propionispora vibrioides TaxID=112903 RepID=A0A1H8NHR8_9FIRM|nr:YlmH/Sll1252 family protein [Propionispora vibrioides]SEO29170.1 RNA-binding protein YlmH, contains S4-like domain [Propionispora vibrioides]